MEEQSSSSGSGPAWALGLFTRQKVPNDVPPDSGEELPPGNAKADHLLKYIRSPRSMPEHPSLDVPLHGLLVATDGSSHIGYHRPESLLLEDWLNLMLKRPSPPVSSRYSFSM